MHHQTKSKIALSLVLVLFMTMVWGGMAYADVSLITTEYNDLAILDQTYHQPNLPDYEEQVFKNEIVAVNTPFNVTENYSYATINLTPSVRGTYVIQVTNADFSGNYRIYHEDPTGTINFDQIPNYTRIYSDSSIQELLGYKNYGYTPSVADIKYSLASRGDTVLWLYENDFDPSDPLTNVLTADDDYTNTTPSTWGWPYSYLEFDLEANQKYVLVVTTWESNETGKVDLSVTGPGETVFSFDPPVDDQVTTPKPRVPSKRDPITLYSGVNRNAQTNDLAYFVAIPEQWMESTAKVEFWLDSAQVNAKSDGYTFIGSAKTILKSVGSSLLDTYQVDLMQRVTTKDGTTNEAKVAQENVRGNFTIRLPIPAHLLNTQNLGIVYIESTGLTANLASKIVVIDGVSYIEFENNCSAVYGFVSDQNNATVR